MLADANVAESGPSAKQNWWAATRELVRVTKGKRLILSGGAVAEADLRPSRDVVNLYVSYFFLVLSQFFFNHSVRHQYYDLRPLSGFYP